MDSTGADFIMALDDMVPTTAPLLLCNTGADIIMALDDVVPTTANDPARFLEATHRTTRWIDRCISAHSR